ncbi:uncharacterized protein LOC113518225 isoform X2 [Galleria mellonella]|uniref:Uncharacterized protein LOC113518225 isoform X2 n=1 Tax=Galleria mellonella TaxID=7137 RepID=A0A6J1WT16_GALME|nr:uncharacterized protein LOC113518225 isoform X2 [Galleria mellonella]
MTSQTIADTMPLTQEKRLDSNFSNNNDQSYLHKKFKKMASTIAVFPTNQIRGGETRHKETDVVQSDCNTSISNGSIAAAHPEIEKIKVKLDTNIIDVHDEKKNVQTIYNDENFRLSNVNNNVQVTGQTSYADEFSNKTENIENDFIRDAYNGGIGGRYICPYCKLSCAKPSVLQKHIRAHTNERPYPCVPCGFAFKTKSNLYKHRRSRTHALRLQGSDAPATINEDDLSGGSESDTSLPPTSISDAGSDSSVARTEHFKFNDISLQEFTDYASQSTNLSLNDNAKSRTIYKPKFRGACYQETDEKDKLKKTMSSNADFLTEHISKIISDNEAIVDVIDTPLQKKYGKIKQIAESKQLLHDYIETKPESSPLNLTKNSNDSENSFRKRSHSESFTNIDNQKHPLNPERSIIKDLLLKTKSNCLSSITGEMIEGLGPLFVCPLCQIIYRSADNLEIHRTYYCKGSTVGSNSNVSLNSTQKDVKLVRPENIFVRSNSVNVRLPETLSNSSPKSSGIKNKPENLNITKLESNDIAAPLPSPGPLLGSTRLVDTRTPTEYRKTENLKIKPLSPKRRIDSRSDTYSPRLTENISPRTEMYSQSKIRCIDGNSVALRYLEEMSQHMRSNSTSLQMFGGEVKILDHAGGTTTLRIEPSKNQLSPILVQQNLSPSKLGNDTEASSVVVRSGLHSGGTMVHKPPTPKEIINTPQPQTPRITISTASGNLPNIHDITHFQFPPLSAITAFNPLTLPPLSPSSSPNGATTILHGGKLIPHVPGIPGPNTPGAFTENSLLQVKSVHGDVLKSPVKSPRDDTYVSVVQSIKGNGNKYDSLRNARSPSIRTSSIEIEKNNQDHLNNDTTHYVTTIPAIRIKNVDDQQNKPLLSVGKSSIGRPEGVFKRNSDSLSKTPVLKENNYPPNKLKIKDKITSTCSKNNDIQIDNKIRSFNFENLITKVEIFNNQIPSSSEVQKNTNAQETSTVSISNERSETSYFQKNVTSRNTAEERKPKFLRPSTLPLKPGTFTPKRHHGITPNANTMPLVSPETPRPAKAYGQLYLNGNAYTYLGLKCSTKVFYCTINRPQPTYVPNQHFLSMYSNWQLLSELTPDPLGLSASSTMSLYDSRHRPQNVTVAVVKQDLILTHSSKWNKNSKEYKQVATSVDSKKSDESKLQISDSNITPKKELTGGFESNEEYTYVRGRGRGRYVCSECGIRCKKPSMLKKHIRTHTDVRPYTCTHCAFSFKTKGNLTKHMKSKAHYKKCCELGINPNEGNDIEGGEMTQCSGETDDDTDSEGDEGNEGETESSDTEVCKSRLPEHEAAHCLLSLGSSRPTTSATPGLITSARPSTYPYTPTGLESMNETSEKILPVSSVDSGIDVENEPMDLSKSDTKPVSNIPEIPTARESSVLASLASNTAKLPQHQTQWANGEPMLHTYLTERALLDSKIKQSQLTCNLTKLRKIDLEQSAFTDTNNSSDNDSINIVVTSVRNLVTMPNMSPKNANTLKTTTNENDNVTSLSAITDNNTTDRVKDASVPLNTETKIVRTMNQTNAENAKHVVSEYLKQARINLNLVKIQEDLQNQTDNSSDDSNNLKLNTEDNMQIQDKGNKSEPDSVKMTSVEHDPIARKVVIGVGGVAFKVTKGKGFESTSFPPGRLMEDGRRVCDFCNKTFIKPSQLRLHLNIHYMERPFRCSVCAVSFRTRGHLQKHERSGSHHNKVSMTSTFGAATTFNPRPFRCSDCNIAFRIHGHLAKHLRSKMHVMRLECLFKLPFGTFTEIERAGVSLTDIDTTDCASSLASLQSLAQKLHEKDPTKLEYREPNGMVMASLPLGRESSEDEDAVLAGEKICDSEKSSEMKTINNSEGQDVEATVNYSATDN